MDIHLVKGSGHGPTRIAALDAALFAAGISDYNLIPLSSILPPGSRLLSTPWRAEAKDYGNRLYLVVSTAHTPDDTTGAVAALGWVRSSDGRGFLVEDSGGDRDTVVERVSRALEDMRQRRNLVEAESGCEVMEVKAGSPHSCALVAAVFKSAPW